MNLNWVKGLRLGLLPIDAGLSSAIMEPQYLNQQYRQEVFDDCFDPYGRAIQ